MSFCRKNFCLVSNLADLFAKSTAFLRLSERVTCCSARGFDITRFLSSNPSNFSGFVNLSEIVDFVQLIPGYPQNWAAQELWITNSSANLLNVQKLTKPNT